MNLTPPVMKVIVDVSIKLIKIGPGITISHDTRQEAPCDVELFVCVPSLCYVYHP